ncbi:hypothetical protein GCWU000282_02961 [Catonella morbi ATCC 51271]|uniref:DNA helicase n=1 Tax=Catonella morbi ATCC 51271 TaxID=592026 RepID=V2Y199_9FIRM|nr:AAA domain-containing protein [Catonella morbi]ESL01842.1 hypothetical protein GCWU000282_02961 [Catonella morbi ATCC 51271]
MDNICRELFRAIHEGKWLKIEYKNKSEEITRYWISVVDLEPYTRVLKVDGLHLGYYTVMRLDKIFLDSIISAEVVNGSFCERNEKLIEDIAMNPEKYVNIFKQNANLKILSYLEMCNKLDGSTYETDFELIHYLDRDTITDDVYELSEEQFKLIVKYFQYNKDKKKFESGGLQIKNLAMNVLSVHTNKGLHVLAYRKLGLDVKARALKPAKEITICTQFTIVGEVQNVRKFLEAEEYELLSEFEKNQEAIKDAIASHLQGCEQVDDIPYIIGLGLDVALDLNSEYKAILDMYGTDEVSTPIKAFFGELLAKPRRSKAYPIALINKNINLDQLLAINNAMKFPCAYIQGPPGTGKTNTIKNTIITAFFNETTVLFASYNNTPIDSVTEALSNLKYKGKTIPFPILRLGNTQKLREAINYIKELRKQVAAINIYEDTLNKRKEDRKVRAKQLSDLLKNYEDVVELRERKESMEHLMKYQKGMKNEGSIAAFQMDLQMNQMNNLNQKIDDIGEVSNDKVMELLDRNDEEFYQYLYFTSAKYIKKLETKPFSELIDILDADMKEDDRIQKFAGYLKKTENVKSLQRVFPIMVTTCISAHRLGKPEILFDMVIIDEASQCNVAISLVPIIRGENMMLVGDPQQLRPVVLLDDISNIKLRKKYNISDEYDYKENSIYKTYLACDAVSDEILLRNHYRSHKKIIDFNNKKYYNSKLEIMTKSEEKEPLVYVNVENSRSETKNTSPAEVAEILDYAEHNKDKSIAVITPFVNQRELIERGIRDRNLRNISCGTVHAFQGDEKDVVLFSTALSDRTTEGTYNWLKNNKELLNVATSRAKEKLILLASTKELERLHGNNTDDDLYELVNYIRTNGQSAVTKKQVSSRALGVQPFSTATENAFLDNLTHALGNIWLTQSRYTIHKEVAISQVFQENLTHNVLFYMGRFDFVVYEKQGKAEIPILAIELDGKEHYTEEAVRERDRKKNEICKAHNLQIIRVENSYARRYNYIKDILMDYFKRTH